MDCNILRHIRFYIIFGIYSALHFFLTFVVTLFLISTLNIINQRFFHLDKLDYIEIAATAVVFFISIIVFFRSFSKIESFIKDTFFKGAI